MPIKKTERQNQQLSIISKYQQPRDSEWVSASMHPMLSGPENTHMEAPPPTVHPKKNVPYGDLIILNVKACSQTQTEKT